MSLNWVDRGLTSSEPLIFLEEVKIFAFIFLFKFSDN